MENAKRTYHRARTVRTDHILRRDDISIFESDVAELRILRITLQSDHLERSMDGDTEIGQFCPERTFGNALGNEENVWVSRVRFETIDLGTYKACGLRSDAERSRLGAL